MTNTLHDITVFAEGGGPGRQIWGTEAGFRGCNTTYVNPMPNGCRDVDSQSTRLGQMYGHWRADYDAFARPLIWYTAEDTSGDLAPCGANSRRVDDHFGLLYAFYNSFTAPDGSVRCITTPNSTSPKPAATVFAGLS